MPPLTTVPDTLRPYQFHGVQLDYREGREQQEGDCPFCLKEGKFSVNAVNGLWRCWSCGEGNANDKGGGGNVVVFLRKLWELSDARTNGATKQLAVDRKLLYPETLTRWGVCQSIIDGCWLVPGYDAGGKLCTLYRYGWDRKTKRMHLWPTPGQPQGLHGATPWPKTYSTVYVCEGWGDGCCLWETMRLAKRTDDGLTHTANELSSLLADALVVAVPNCGSVGEPFQRWLPLFAGKRVVLLFDNDHPREVDGRTIEGAGLQATKRAAALLGKAEEPPKSIDWLRWEPEATGYSDHAPTLKNGFDVRDWLTTPDDVPGRIEALDGLFTLVEDVPAEWVPERVPATANRVAVEPAPCRDWRTLVMHWRNAMQWRRDLEDVLAISMAVALSTNQSGDQLFLQMIGSAGSGKTRFCDGMLVSKRCYALEHLTGFHSGYNDGSGEDFSLLARINHKCLITPEGDVLMSSPRFIEIMSQQRRIFDGTSGATYKTRKEEVRYEGLRTPWIMAGTPALLDSDQSRLGDRFLRAMINDPTEAEKRNILRMAGYASLREVRQTCSNGDPQAIIEENLRRAYQMTGGYIDHLTDDPERRISAVLDAMDSDAESTLVDATADMAEFTADLRARPHKDRSKDNTNDTKELPTRLQKQYPRLAACLAVVLNRPTVDDDVLRLVRKVAYDTARGHSLQIVGHLAANPAGLETESLAVLTGQSREREQTMLWFLRKIGCVEDVAVLIKPGGPSRKRWRLTERLKRLYREVVTDGRGA